MQPFFSISCCAAPHCELIDLSVSARLYKVLLCVIDELML